MTHFLVVVYKMKSFNVLQVCHLMWWDTSHIDMAKKRPNFKYFDNKCSEERVNRRIVTKVHIFLYFFIYATKVSF